jgi:hypothetical protein
MRTWEKTLQHIPPLNTRAVLVQHAVLYSVRGGWIRVPHQYGHIYDAEYVRERWEGGLMRWNNKPDGVDCLRLMGQWGVDRHRGSAGGNKWRAG